MSAEPKETSVTTEQIQAEIEQHNKEVEAKKKGLDVPIRPDIPFSDQLSQATNDQYLQMAVEAARKNTQTLRINGKDKVFNYHAISFKEKLEISKMEEKRANSIVNAAEYIIRKKSGEEVQYYSDVDMEYRYTMAKLFLRDENDQQMSREDFDGAEPEQLNLIIEGYLLRTEKPLPPPFEKKK